MKSLIWKEWRENLKWAALPGVLILGPMITLRPCPCSWSRSISPS